MNAILTSRPYRFLATRVRYEHSWRNGDDYVGNDPFLAGHSAAFINDEFATCNVGVWPSGECPFENHPLLRKSYLANRERDDLSFHLTLLPLESVNVSLNLNYRNEDYEDSDFGITNTEHWSPGVDVSYTPFDRLTTYAFYTFERSRIEREGLAWVGFPQGGVPPIDQTVDFPGRDWNTVDEDTTHTVGLFLASTRSAGASACRSSRASSNSARTTSTPRAAERPTWPSARSSRPDSRTPTTSPRSTT